MTDTRPGGETAGVARAASWQATYVDLLLALGAFVALLIDPVFSDRSNDVTPLAGLLALVAAVPLVVRRRYPLGVLAIEVAVLMACLAVFHPSRAAVGIVMLMVFTVASTGRRLRSLIVGALMAPVVTIAVLLTSQKGGAGDVIAYLALVFAALVAGDAVRARQRIQSLIAEEHERERAAAAQRLFDQDRLAVAHELHDVIGHALVAINVRAAGAVRLHRRAGKADLPLVLDEIARTSAEALTELRSTLRTLRLTGDDPAPLQPVQSLDDLAELVERMGRSGLRVEMAVTGSLAGVPPSVGHAAFRIIQESLTNVLRHSTADCAVVTINVAEDGLTVAVTDNGRLREPRASEHAGHGLAGMRERAATLGGTVQAGPIDERGWRVRAQLPVTGGRGS